MDMATQFNNAETNFGLSMCKVKCSYGIKAPLTHTVSEYVFRIKIHF